MREPRDEAVAGRTADLEHDLCDMASSGKAANSDDRDIPAMRETGRDSSATRGSAMLSETGTH